MLSSPRAVREVFRSSILAGQGYLIAFPNRPLRRAGVRSVCRKSGIKHRALGSTALVTEPLKLSLNWLRRPPPRGARYAALFAIAVIALDGVPRPIRAQTWSPPSPGSNLDFNQALNWTPGRGADWNCVVRARYGPRREIGGDIQPSGAHTAHAVSVPGKRGKLQYRCFLGTLRFNGGGVTNLSAVTQEVIVEPGGTLNFNNSTAGDTTIHYGNRGGTISFSDASTAGSANFENQSGGTMMFAGTSTAGAAAIANDFGTGTITFADQATPAAPTSPTTSA